MVALLRTGPEWVLNFTAIPGKSVLVHCRNHPRYFDCVTSAYIDGNNTVISFKMSQHLKTLYFFFFLKKSLRDGIPLSGTIL